MSPATQLAHRDIDGDFAVETTTPISKSGANLEAMADAVDSHIQNSPALRLAVMDVQRYDEALVILANGLMSPAFIRLALEPLWHGPIEVYDAGSMFGAAAND